MKRVFHLSAVFVALTLVGAGCPAKQATDVKADAQAQQVADQEQRISASPREMMRGGKSLHCTFAVKDDAVGIAENGEMFIDGKNGKFRSDVDMTITKPRATEYKMYSVTDGTYVYSWGSATPNTGFKVLLSDRPSADKANAAGPEAQDLENPINFSCKAWNVDSSKFNLPAGINFTDVDKMRNSLKAPAVLNGVNMCDVCNQIAEPNAKSRCKKDNCK